MSKIRRKKWVNFGGNRKVGVASEEREWYLDSMKILVTGQIEVSEQLLPKSWLFEWECAGVAILDAKN
jgi:hypothetical protein